MKHQEKVTFFLIYKKNSIKSLRLTEKDLNLPLFLGFTVLTPQLLRLLQVRNESKQNPIYGSHFSSAYEKYYKNNRNTK